ncbi:MAG: cyclic pyranopterin monophosphate synthase MoaC [Xanthomonadales bacterium]|nr:cyclic pyranopterin monophosphate synthase MoaC [Xanthomonadales bacterium]
MFSHLNKDGQPGMVDVGQKAVSRRTAHARCTLELPKILADALRAGGLQTKKGPLVATAIIAGVMAAKNTPGLIPLCHPIPLDDCKISIEQNADGNLQINAIVVANYRTGVEMEALTAVSVAALTVYDMCKSVTKGIVIRDTRLIEKRGGKSDFTSSNSNEKTDE